MGPAQIQDLAYIFARYLGDSQARPVSTLVSLAVFVLLAIGFRNLIALAGWDNAAVKARVEEIARRKEASRPAEEEDEEGGVAGTRRGVVRLALAGRKGLRVVNRFLERNSLDRSLTLALERADVNLKAGEFLVACAASAIASGLMGLVWLGAFGAVVFGVPGLWFPVFWLGRRQSRRVKQFNGQLPDGLTMVANSLRSGYSLLQSLDVVAKEMPKPISAEFGRVVQEAGLNVPLEESLGSLMNRVQSDDLDLMVTAVLIQREVGGNLAEVLDKIAYTIRDRIRILGEVRALTAQGRMSGIVIALLPFALCVILTLMNREYMEPFFRHPLGRAMLIVAVIMQATGIMIVRRIVNIRV